MECYPFPPVCVDEDGVITNAGYLSWGVLILAYVQRMFASIRGVRGDRSHC